MHRASGIKRQSRVMGDGSWVGGWRLGVRDSIVTAPKAGLESLEYIGCRQDGSDFPPLAAESFVFLFFKN